MKTTAMLKLAVSTLILGTTIVGCSPSTRAMHPANASDTKMGKAANKAAVTATKALAARDFATAVSYAEIAVAALPHDAGYRMLLGQAYLRAGRFTSAETAFSETLTLMPDHERAALNLALVQIALGKKTAALTTLADYHDKISASDYGLALALAGDIDGGVKALEFATREPRADAKSRQNLALAYALAGEWNKAHVTAAQDLAPADADARIIQWAAFAQPGNETGRVATLLGVQPVIDTGQPTRLALAPTVPSAVQVAEAAPAATPIPAAVAAATPVVDTPPAAFETASPPPTVHIAHDAPVIQAATLLAKQEVAATPPRRAVAFSSSGRSVQSGKFVVQLGAFENAAVSRNAWSKVAPRFGLENYEPANSSTQVRGANFVRLSVGGFVTRAGATQVCARIKAAGGNCFVRGMLADKPAQWVQRRIPKTTRVASN
ncbi:SPOR domain-containing protein [Sphingomonas paeninsulae]|uniref:SPOR domain-containing protein n=1 Tax=Sphingomonas paeninsulae TaxID=2319844 RepID=A0A494TDZ5_SPHPE|nr:SPOR domain-containing protein [Sphingomonas paeninsulae]AYJ87759.1 SPOR domain-containing protein [Sphingomonas paeninsulae]